MLDDRFAGKTKDQIIETIRKLLALADPDRNTSEAECKAAMERVHTLLRKYNMEMAEIAEVDSEGKPVIDYDIEEIVGVEFKKSSTPRWVWDLMGMVARHTETAVYRNKKVVPNQRAKKGWSQVTRFIFFGDKVDAVIAADLGQYLYKAISKLANQNYPGQYPQQTAFIKGINMRLYERFEEIRRQVHEEVHNGKYEMVMVGKQDAIQEYGVNQLNLKTHTAKKSNNRIDTEAYFRGKAAGGGLDLTTGKHIAG